MTDNERRQKNSQEILEVHEHLMQMTQEGIAQAKFLWRVIQQRSDATQVLFDGTFGDLGADREVQADVIMGQEMTRFFLSHDDVAGVITEENVYQEGKEGEYTIFIDPLDSSANAIRTLERIKLGLPAYTHDLPFGSVIAIAENGGQTMKDVVAAGFVRLDTGFSYIAVRGGGFWMIDPQGRKIKVELPQITNQPRSVAELLKTGWTMWVENYYPETRQTVNNKLLLPDEKGYIRSQGCGANEQVSVAAGIGGTFFCTTAKLHEPAASILMIQEAGGVAVDPFTMGNAQDLPLRDDFRTQKHPLLLAINRELAWDIHQRLLKNDTQKVL